MRGMVGSSANIGECKQLLTRLEKATEQMLALEALVEALRKRVDGPDLPAIHLGVRHIAEALLRHAARAEGAELGSGPDGTLNRLKDALYPKVKDRLGGDFWRQVDGIQRVVNAHTHYQGDDVYHVNTLRQSDPWDEIVQVIRHLAVMAEQFAIHWQPSTPPPVAKAATPERSASERKKPAAQARQDERTIDIADVTVSDARTSEEVRAWLLANSGMQPRGVTRRLNEHHGATKLRNVFPEAFEVEQEDRSSSEVDKVLDYEEIGNLTIKQAREAGIAADLALLTGLAEATVSRKLGELHGSGIVRRQFDWYNPSVLGELTVKAALDYGLAPLLSRVFGGTNANVLTRLRDTPGQTKLRTLYPDLGE